MKNRMFNLTGHSIVVTGAASGIGYAYAEVLAEAGAYVTLCDVNGEALDCAVEALSARGLSVSGAVCDISVVGAIGQTIDRVVEQRGRLDTVFANAGISAGPGFAITQDGCLDGASRGAWDKAIAINLTGTYDTIAAAARHMKSAGRGSIVVTSSISSLLYSPVSAYAYIAAKAGLNAIVRQAVSELGPHNVRINAIAPGFIRTNLAGGQLKTNQAQADKLRTQVPMSRLGDPDDLKGLALLLASDASSYITGTITAIDGGVATR